MKIRKGFVSNSSSSSFIVQWDKKPKSIEEVKKILFGVQETYSYYDDNVSTQRLAETIFNDTEDITEEKIKEEISGQYYYSWGNGSWYQKGYKADEKLCDEYEIEIKAARKEKEEVQQLINEYSKDFRKLERVLDESTLTKQEKEYFNLLDKLDDVREIIWGNSAIMKKLVDDSTKKFLNDSKDKYVALYEYGDDWTIGSIIERGGAFDNVEHTKTSHH